MTAQTQVSKDKFILDATAGFRMMWYNKHHPNCIYLDQRPECEPDIVGDFRDLKQFPDCMFRLVVFDPPHDIRNGPSDPQSSFVKNFGYLKTETWVKDLYHGFRECWRVLAPYGILIFKWNTFARRLRTVKTTFPTDPLFVNIIKIKKKKDPKHNAETYWFCFMKIPPEQEEKQ